MLSDTPCAEQDCSLPGPLGKSKIAASQVRRGGQCDMSHRA